MAANGLNGMHRSLIWRGGGILITLSQYLAATSSHSRLGSPGRAALQFLRCGTLRRARHQRQQAHARGLPDLPPGEPPRPREATRAGSDRGPERRRTRPRLSPFARTLHWPSLPGVSPNSLDEEQVGSNADRSRFSARFSCERVRQGCQDRG
eukprot:5229959-Prymnesium_polylepis.1